MKNKTKQKLEWVFLISILALVIILLSACRTSTIYIPVENVKTEYKDKLIKDSVYLMDSIYVERWKSGDTIYQTKEKYKYLYRDKLIRDSVYINDTIRVPYPVVETKTLKAPYTWYEKLLLAFGCIGIGITIFSIYKKLK